MFQIHFHKVFPSSLVWGRDSVFPSRDHPNLSRTDRPASLEWAPAWPFKRAVESFPGTRKIPLTDCG
jgi:hypothetical protein